MQAIDQMQDTVIQLGNIQVVLSTVSASLMREDNAKYSGTLTFAQEHLGAQIDALDNLMMEIMRSGRMAV